RGVALASRFFWQEYPQAFELRPGVLTYNMWAQSAPPAKVGMGVAKTHEFVLYFHGKTPPPQALLAALAEPVLARVNARWAAATHALPNAIAPGKSTNAFLREVGVGYRAYQQEAAVERWDDNGMVRCPMPSGTRSAGAPTAEVPRAERPRRGFY